jgi:hypothetical protein
LNGDHKHIGSGRLVYATANRLSGNSVVLIFLLSLLSIKKDEGNLLHIMRLYFDTLCYSLHGRTKGSFFTEDGDCSKYGKSSTSGF